MPGVKGEDAQLEFGDRNILSWNRLARFSTDARGADQGDAGVVGQSEDEQVVALRITTVEGFQDGPQIGTTHPPDGARHVQFDQESLERCKAVFVVVEDEVHRTDQFPSAVRQVGGVPGGELDLVTPDTQELEDCVLRMKVKGRSQRILAHRISLLG